MVDPGELREVVDAHYEWLLVRGSGRSFAVTNREIGIFDGNGDGPSIEFLDDNGIHSRKLSGYSFADGNITIDVQEPANANVETVTLVPRTPAAELAAEVEIARLEKVNEIAQLIAEYAPGKRIGRVALNAENGRLGQIGLTSSDKRPIAAIVDVTASLTAESLFTAGILWLEKLGTVKKPVLEIWVICEKRQARNAQKLHALLSDRWKAKITVLEVLCKNEPIRLKQLPSRKIPELWREKTKRLSVPPNVEPSDTARGIMDLSPEKIDVVYSNRGETLRFLGLPFARIRVIGGQEWAWFGVGKKRHRLISESWGDFVVLVNELEENRSQAAQNKRHEYYRSSPEAWLESILKRDISLLDANLILSPIYNQFRSSDDKIDLLALRRDGRLVIIELKTQPDREIVFQAADYWRKIELQRRRGILQTADLFGGREIIDKPALVYLAAPAWSFHRDFEFFARALSREIELWRFELHENWREKVKVLSRHQYMDVSK
jgi:hypothetical protein